MDRDSHFSDAFRTILDEAGVTPVQLPPKSPNLNAHLERFFRSLKSEALERMLFFGEKSLRRTVDSYLSHYHAERNHQGLDNKIIDPSDDVGAIAGKIECQERLGGILKYYHRVAA
jgi:putative transposase